MSAATETRPSLTGAYHWRVWQIPEVTGRFFFSREQVAKVLAGAEPEKRHVRTRMCTSLPDGTDILGPWYSDTIEPAIPEPGYLD